MGNVTVNAALLQAQFNDSDISATNAEIIIDAAINMLNAFGMELSNLSGTAGSKTGTYSSADAGRIMAVAQQVYSKHFKNADNASVNVSSMGLNYSGDNQLLNFAQKLALYARGRSFKRA